MKGYMGITELADYLSLSRSHIEHNWPEWVAKHGVQVSRAGKKKLLFNKASIDRMMEASQVYTPMIFSGAGTIKTVGSYRYGQMRRAREARAPVPLAK
jgi:hypothetical protein